MVIFYHNSFCTKKVVSIKLKSYINETTFFVCYGCRVKFDKTKIRHCFTIMTIYLTICYVINLYFLFIVFHVKLRKLIFFVFSFRLRTRLHRQLCYLHPRSKRDDHVVRPCMGHRVRYHVYAQTQGRTDLVTSATQESLWIVYFFIPSTYVCIALNFRIEEKLHNPFLFELHVVGIRGNVFNKVHNEIQNVHINLFMLTVLRVVLAFTWNLFSTRRYRYFQVLI